MMTYSTDNRYCAMTEYFHACMDCDHKVVSFPDPTLLEEGKGSGTLRIIPWVC